MGRFRGVAIGLAVGATCALSAGGAAASTPPSAPQLRAAHAAQAEAGVLYRWDGASPATGFDASGLVVWAYGQAGIRSLPHVSGGLWSAGRRIALDDLRPGDLVFFHQASHVGIYLGGGRFVHATHTGAPVAISSLASYRAAGAYTGAVRIAGSR